MWRQGNVWQKVDGHRHRHGVGQRKPQAIRVARAKLRHCVDQLVCWSTLRVLDFNVGIKAEGLQASKGYDTGDPRSVPASRNRILMLLTNFSGTR